MSIVHLRIVLGFFGLVWIMSTCFFLMDDLLLDFDSYGLDAFVVTPDTHIRTFLLLANIAIVCCIAYRIAMRRRPGHTPVQSRPDF